MQCETCKWYGETQIAVDDIKPFCGHRWHERLDPDCGDYEAVLPEIEEDCNDEESFAEG